MSISPESFVTMLVEADPRSAELAAGHLADNGELLIHLLLPDVLRLCVRQFHAGDHGMSARLLTLINEALLQGDARLQNAVLISFVEHAGYGDGESPEFMATWPSGLRDALNGS